MDKYQFFYLKTGGGHLAPAKAVAESITNTKGNLTTISLIDGLENGPKFARRIIEDGYKHSINKALLVFEFLYAFNKVKPFAQLTSTVVSALIYNGIEKRILKEKPSKIVIFHFFLIKPVQRVIRKNNLNIPVITVVTDPFTAHPLWFLDKKQKFIVFSDQLMEKCIRMGIPEQNLQVFPFVLDKKFSGKPTEKKKIEVRKKFGYSNDSRILLIIGGGEGMPGGKKIIKEFISNDLDAEIIIVCGKDKDLYESILKLKQKYNIANLKVYGFVNFVHSLLLISDVVITKCGASTCMEILLSGKIPVINKYIWEQEKGNMEFITEGKMGLYERRKKSLPLVVNRLLSDPYLYNSMHSNIKRASIRNGVKQVSEYIINC